MPNLSRRHLVTTATALPALALPAAALPTAAAPAVDSRDSMVIRAQQMVDLLGTCYVREGWKLDADRAAQFVESVGTFDEDNGECPKFRMVLDWMHDHGQSLDWLADGDIAGLITARAALRATVGDAELLRLGAELEAVIVDWHGQRAIDRKQSAAIKAALKAAGLSVDHQSLPDDEFRAYLAKRDAVTGPIYRARGDTNEAGESIAWNDIHGRMWPTIDAIMAIQPRTLAGLAVMARAFTLHHAEQWEPDADEGLHHRAFMEAVCAVAGVVPVPLDSGKVQS
jgi:hypothetical protein